MRLTSDQGGIQTVMAAGDQASGLERHRRRVLLRFLILPPKATVAEATHFSMFMLKAVLDGRAKQIIDLAKVNLTR